MRSICLRLVYHIVSRNVCFVNDLTAMLNQCKHYAVNLHYPETRSEIRVVNQLFRQAHNFFSILYQLIGSLPPYDPMPPRKDVFAEMLDYYEWLINMSSDGKSNDCVPLDEIDEAEDMDRVLQFDAELKAFIIEQQTFIEDLIRVQKVFAPFLERVHHRSEFLSNEDYEHICRLHGDALNAVRALRPDLE